MAQIIKADQLDRLAAARITALKLRELAVQASQVVLDGRKQAARLLAEAREEAKLLELQGEEKGYREGFQRGRQEGHAAGERAAHKQIAAKLAGQNLQLAEPALPGTYEPVETPADTGSAPATASAESMERAH